MSLSAFALVMLSALLHATWNLFAKRVASGAPFIWLFDTVSVLLYAPFAVWLWAAQPVPFSWPQVLIVLGSSLLHLGYFLSLQRGYCAGDLSLVYPLARGTGPLFSTLAAVLFLGERPTLWALAGGLLIVAGVGVFTGISTGSRTLLRTGTHARQALLFGLLTGVFIAAYTLFDKLAVTTFLLPPLLFTWLGTAGRAVMVSPLVIGRRRELRQMWQGHRVAVLAVAVLSPLAYILVLTAMVFTLISYVAPTREVGILIAAVMGASLLKEGQVVRRLVATSLILAGVALLLLG